MIDVIAELKCLGESNRCYDAIFIERITNKRFNDLRSYRPNREDQWKAISYIKELFPDILQDCSFIAWLAKKNRCKALSIASTR